MTLSEFLTPLWHGWLSVAAFNVLWWSGIGLVYAARKRAERRQVAAVAHTLIVRSGTARTPVPDRTPNPKENTA